MYFSSPQLLPWRDIWKVWKTNTGSKEAAKTTPKLYTLSSITEPYKGNIKKAHYRRGISAAFGSTDCRCQLADLHRSYRRQIVCSLRSKSFRASLSWKLGQEQLSILDKLVRKRLLRRLQTIVRPAWNENPSLPVLHLRAHLTAAARLWAHELWLGWGKDEVSFNLYSPSLFLLRLRMHQIHMLNSSDVLVLRRVHSSPRAEAAKEAGGIQVRCFACHVKVVLYVATNVPELPGKQRHLVMSNLESALRLHRLWL